MSACTRHRPDPFAVDCAPTLDERLDAHLERHRLGAFDPRQRDMPIPEPKQEPEQ